MNPVHSFYLFMPFHAIHLQVIQQTLECVFANHLRHYVYSPHYSYRNFGSNPCPAYYSMFRKWLPALSVHVLGLHLINKTKPMTWRCTCCAQTKYCRIQFVVELFKIKYTVTLLYKRVGNFPVFKPVVIFKSIYLATLIGYRRREIYQWGACLPRTRRVVTSVY